jgi:hypothetical protein
MLLAPALPICTNHGKKANSDDARGCHVSYVADGDMTGISVHLLTVAAKRGLLPILNMHVQ